MSSPIFKDALLQQAFDADGIVTVELLNQAEIEELNSFYHNTVHGLSDRAFHSTMFSSNPAYRKQVDAAIRLVLLSKIEAVIPQYRILFANYIAKESAAGTRVGVHQDWNFTSPEILSLNCWIPLCDINAETGLFYALKGSHQTFRNIRYTPYADNAYETLNDYILKHSSGYEIKAGTALIYHGALVHYSEPNQSNHLRLAVGAAMIPNNAPNLHYYKRDRDLKALEVYAVNEAFYQQFDFYQEPKGVPQIGLLEDYPELPSLEELIKQTA